MNGRIAWPQLLRAALRDLRLKPGEFWALTPIELMLMFGIEGPLPGISRAELNDLMARYPDTPRRRARATTVAETAFGCRKPADRSRQGKEGACRAAEKQGD